MPPCKHNQPGHFYPHNLPSYSFVPPPIPISQLETPRGFSAVPKVKSSYPHNWLIGQRRIPFNGRLLALSESRTTVFPGRDESDVSASSNTTLEPVRSTPTKRKRDLPNAADAGGDASDGYYGGKCFSVVSEDELLEMPSRMEKAGEVWKGKTREIIRHSAEKQSPRKRARAATEYRKERERGVVKLSNRSYARYSTPTTFVSLANALAKQDTTLGRPTDIGRIRGKEVTKEMVDEMEEGESDEGFDEESDGGNDRKLHISDSAPSVLYWSDSVSSEPLMSAVESGVSPDPLWSESDGPTEHQDSDCVESYCSVDSDSEDDPVASDPHVPRDIDMKGTSYQVDFCSDNDSDRSSSHNFSDCESCCGFLHNATDCSGPDSGFSGCESCGGGFPSNATDFSGSDSGSNSGSGSNSEYGSDSDTNNDSESSCSFLSLAPPARRVKRNVSYWYPESEDTENHSDGKYFGLFLDSFMGY